MLPNYNAQPRAPVLIVDDRWEDNFLLQRLLRVARIANSVSTAGSALEAIQFLKIARVLPCLVCLDISMPLVGGFEVLRWIRQQESMSEVAVVMLSGSNETADVQRAHELGADSYLLKYPSSQTLAEVVAIANRPTVLRGEFPQSTPAPVTLVPRSRG